MWVPCDQKAIFRTKLVKKLTLVSLLVKKLTVVSLLVLACVFRFLYQPRRKIGEKHIFVNTAISRKVVVKSTRNNPKYCGWLWIHCSSKKFQRRAGKGMDERLRVLTESVKSKFDNYSVRNSVLIISHITFRDCHVHIFFPTTILEIAVFALSAFGSMKNKRCRHFQRNKLLLFTVKKVTLPGDL